MKKIMFNDEYCLTAAVLAEIKKQTRRIITGVLPEIQELRVVNDVCEYKDPYTGKWHKSNSKHHQPKYKVGEVVAVAQSYKSINFSHDDLARVSFCEPEAGWNNKMFVKAELMPHQIRIENVKVERLQDISEIDCIEEGIYDLEPYGIRPKFTADNLGEVFFTAKEAYAALIDQIIGKGTWESNPWAFVYDFDLVKNS